ncbi:MAG: MGMT family protein [Shewanella sp.]
MAKIWQVVAMIPEGKVSSYGKLADLAGLPGRARYVSTALKAAPAQLALPWHRVLNHQGRIAFAANSAHFQQQLVLLQAEGIIVNQGKVKLSEYEWQPELPTLVLALPF